MKSKIKLGLTLVIALATLSACGNKEISAIPPNISNSQVSVNSSSVGGISSKPSNSTSDGNISITYPDALDGDPIKSDTVAQNYYKNISNTKTGQDLIIDLYNLIHPKKCKTAYGSIWDYLPYCDADPQNPSSGKVIAFYRGTPASKSDMNKEHVWPSSRGGQAIEGDPHMVRPTLTKDNSGRGNDFYNENPTSYDPAELGAPEYRGIAARIIFYCAVQEYKNLTLVDKTTDSTIDRTHGTMGKLLTLLKWNIEYPVDETEILRNEVLSGARSVNGRSFNFNRNPFIDNRAFACRIWGDTNAETRSVCSATK